MTLITNNQLIDSATQFEQLDWVPSGICIVDQDLNILAWNTTLETWTGCCKEDALGNNLGDLYPSVLKPRVKSRIDQVFSTGNQVVLSAAIHKHFLPVKIDSNDDKHMVQRTVIRAIELESRLAIVSMSDISIQFSNQEQLRGERKRLAVSEAEVQQKADNLAKSNEDLQQFAYIASHDLQEPLRKISGFCQLLEDEYSETLAGDGLEYLQFVTDGATRMQGLIKDLLEYSRVESREKNLTRVDVQSSFEQALHFLQQRIAERGAEITCCQLPSILGEPTLVIQLFQNLICNGIKYNQSEIPRVDISVERRDGFWRFCVEDNGIGIAKEHLDDVFIVFRRLHGKQEYSGTGIGLGICKRIVQRFDGEIWVESVPGEGSCFYFEFPCVEEIPAR